MADDNPAPVAPPVDAPADTPPQEAPPSDSPAMPPDDKPKRAPAGGWAYLGDTEKGPYIPGVPARDLTPEDLTDLTREGWSLTEVLKTGVYRASPSAAKALADTKEPS